MNKQQIFEEVQNIFQDIFEDKNLIISNDTNSQDIDEWDSLNHINLVSSIEKEFGIIISLGELEDLKNVGEMIDLILNKIND